MSKIGIVAVVYNERSRIEPWLENVTKWADEVYLLDKGSSDGTLEIASRYAVTVVSIPFSPPGCEVSLYKEFLPTMKTEWCIWSTPSEVFTPRLVDYMKAIAAQDDGQLDSVFAYTKIFAFGSSDSFTPYGNYPHLRMWHRDRAMFIAKIHGAVQSRGNAKFIEDADAYVLHQSHATFESFVERQKGYSACEADSLDVRDREIKAMDFIRMGDKYDSHFSANPRADLRLYLGWKISMYMCALACLHRHRETETKSSYEARLAEVRSLWNERPEGVDRLAEEPVSQG
jgi:hypothetical protein